MLSYSKIMYSLLVETFFVCEFFADLYFFGLSVCMSIYLPVFLSVLMSLSLSVCLFVSVCLSLLLRLSVYMYICVFTSLSLWSLSVCLLLYLYLSLRLVCVCVCVFVYLCVSFAICFASYLVPFSSFLFVSLSLSLPLFVSLCCNACFLSFVLYCDLIHLKVMPPPV